MSPSVRRSAEAASATTPDCGQMGPNSSASRTPVQGAAGSGARKRRAPVEAPYGMPRNTSVPLGAAEPRTAPADVTTTGSAISSLLGVLPRAVPRRARFDRTLR